MEVYSYSAEGGRYVGPYDCQPSPLEEGKFLIPAHATEIEPPKVKDGQAAYWTGDQWEVRQTPETMSHRELVDSGRLTIPDGMVLDGEDLRPMTPAELGRAGLITAPVLQSMLFGMIDQRHQEILSEGFLFRGIRFSGTQDRVVEATGIMTGVSVGIGVEFPLLIGDATDDTVSLDTFEMFREYAQALFAFVQRTGLSIGKIKTALKSASNPAVMADLFDSWEAGLH